MQVRYYSIFKFEFRHDYFSQSRGEVFEVIPTESTSRIMNNHQMLLRAVSSSFELFIGVQSLDETVTFSVEGIPPLTFVIRHTDPYFFNYTQWPESDGNQLFYLSNTQDQNTLSAEDFYPSANGFVRSSLTAGTHTVVFKDFSGTVLKQLDIERDDVGQVELPVHDLPTELISWEINNEAQPSFINLGHEIDEKTIGLIQFDLQHWNAATAQDPPYELLFTAQQAYWEFKVALRSIESEQITDQDIRIKLPKDLLEHTSLQGQEEVLFQGPTDGLIMGNQPVKIFLSPIPLTLQHVAQHFCELEIFTEDHENHLQLTLPNPSAELIQKFTPDGGSDSFLVTQIIYV